MRSLLQADDLAAALALSTRSDARLVLLVGERPDSLRSAADRVALELGWRTVDLNRALTQRLLPHTTTERRDLAWDAFEGELGDSTGGIVLVSTDILFEPSLGYRPYEAIRRAARRGPVVAAWFGRVEGTFITRAELGHPEYVKVPLDVPFLSVPSTKGAEV